jgi:hypothetical protein
MWKEMIVACFNLCTCLQLLRKTTEIRQLIRCSGLGSNQAADESIKYVGPVKLWSVSFRSALRGFVQAQYLAVRMRPVSPQDGMFCVHLRLFLHSTKPFLLLWCVNYTTECDIECGGDCTLILKAVLVVRIAELSWIAEGSNHGNLIRDNQRWRQDSKQVPYGHSACWARFLCKLPYLLMTSCWNRSTVVRLQIHDSLCSGSPSAPQPIFDSATCTGPSSQWQDVHSSEKASSIDQGLYLFPHMAFN